MFTESDEVNGKWNKLCEWKWSLNLGWVSKCIEIKGRAMLLLFVSIPSFFVSGFVP